MTFEGTRWPVEVYNLEEGRPMLEVIAEVLALLSPDRPNRPMILALVECVGYPLPHVDGYRVLRNRLTESAANVAAYVHESIPVSRVRWRRMNRTWRRVKRTGVHPPRTILKFRAAAKWWQRATGVRVAVAHHPQDDGANTGPARLEHLEALANFLTPWRRARWWRLLPAKVRDREARRPRVVLWDSNGGAPTLANMTGGQIVALGVDGAVLRGPRTHGVALKAVRFVGDRPLRSDHGRAVRFLLYFPTRWAA